MANQLDWMYGSQFLLENCYGAPQLERCFWGGGSGVFIFLEDLMKIASFPVY